MTATVQIDQIEPAAIREELDRILGSETFSRSERSRELLKYIVEKDLEGEADRLAPLDALGERAGGVGDIRVAAIVESDLQHEFGVLSCPSLGALDHLGDVGGETGTTTDDADANTRLGQPLQVRLDVGLQQAH